MTELDALRGEIDQIDRELVGLLEARLSITAQVGAYKKQKGLPVLDLQREQQVLQSKGKLVQHPKNAGAVTAFFEAVMQISRSQQAEILGGSAALWQPPEERTPVFHPRVMFQGQPGAYGEEAAVLYFGEETVRTHGTEFEDVFLALKQGAADYGVLPIENNSTGAITAVYDLLGKYGCFLVGEQVVPVHHCLMALPGSALGRLQTVYSHEQGFFQSRKFLKQHPNWVLHPMANTAEAAKFVSQAGDETKAAIGSPRAAVLYGLTVLADGINDNAGNGTRFVIVSPQPETWPGSNKISAVFTVPHESGSLQRVLAVLAAYGLNLLKLESRPIPGRSWEYLFFMDFSGNLHMPEMRGILGELQQYTRYLQVLGNYPGGVLGE